MNVNKLMETLAKILSEKKNAKIKIKATKR